MPTSILCGLSTLATRPTNGEVITPLYPMWFGWFVTFCAWANDSIVPRLLSVFAVTPPTGMPRLHPVPGRHHPLSSAASAQIEFVKPDDVGQTNPDVPLRGREP